MFFNWACAVGQLLPSANNKKNRLILDIVILKPKIDF